MTNNEVTIACALVGAVAAAAQRPATLKVVAGARGADGRLSDARRMLRRGGKGEARSGENTTIGLVATHAKLTKVQAQTIAQMAHDGCARAIAPVHTPGDGDSILSAATGTWDGTASNGQMGSLAAEVMADAIVRAATQAASSNGLPGARDLGTVPARFKR